MKISLMRYLSYRVSQYSSKLLNFQSRHSTSELRPSRSNPDIASISQYYGPVKSDSPEHVLKIFRSDQTYKYFPVYKETTAQVSTS